MCTLWLKLKKRCVEVTQKLNTEGSEIEIVPLEPCLLSCCDTPTYKRDLSSLRIFLVWSKTKEVQTNLYDWPALQWEMTSYEYPFWWIVLIYILVANLNCRAALERFLFCDWFNSAPLKLGGVSSTYQPDLLIYLKIKTVCTSLNEPVRG